MLAIEKGDSRHMKPEELYRECFNLLFAGLGNTAAAVTRVLERSSSDEGMAWQERIRCELSHGKKKKKKLLGDKFVVFSKGPRGCIGKDIAMMIVTQAVAAVLSKWRIESAGKVKGGAWLEMQVE